MMLKNGVKKNFIYQMAYEILLIILPFVTSPYIARVIGAEGLGIYSYSCSVAYYFVLFSMLGIKNYGNRAIARTRDNRQLMNETFSNITALHMAVALLCTCAYVLYAVFFSGEKLYFGIQLFYVVSGILDISWFYFGIEKFRLTVTRSTVIKIFNVICVFAFVHERNDLWKYCLIMALGHLLSQAVLWLPVKRYVSFTRPVWAKMHTHLKPMLILFIPAIAVSVYQYMDKIMLGTFSSKEQLGYYENAEKVVNIPVTVIASFGTVMMPKMSHLAANNHQKQSSRYLSLSFQLVMILALGLTFGLAGTGTVFATVFWGGEFEPSGVIIMVLAATVPFIAFANVIRTQYLIPHERDKQYLASVVAGAAVNLAANSLLIPCMGAYGAAVGTVAAEIAVCAVQVLAVAKALPLADYFASFWIFIVAGAAMFTGVYFLGVFLGASVVTLVLQVLSGAVFYGGIAALYLYKTKNEIFINTLSGIKIKKR